MLKTHKIRPYLLAVAGLSLALTAPAAAPPVAGPPFYERKHLIGDPAFRHAGSVTSLAVIDGGRRVLSSSQDGTSRIWDAETGRELHRFVREGRDDAWCAVVTADGKHLLDCGDDDKVTVWNRADRSVVRQLEHGNTVFRLALAPDGKHVAACDNDNKAVLWNFVTGEKVREFDGHKESVYGVAISPDGKRLATASEDDSVRLWDADTGQALHTFDKLGNDAYTVAFSPDGAKLLAVGGDNQVRLWRVADGKPAWERKLPLAARVAAFSPDGRRIAVAMDKGAVALLAVEDGQTQRTLRLPHEDTPWPVAFGPDGKTVWANAEHLICRLSLDADPAAEAGRPIVAPPSGFSRVAAASDGRTVCLAGDNEVWRWDGRGRKLERFAVATADGSVRDLRAAPKGHALLVHTSGHEAWLYDMATGRHLRTIKGSSGGSSQVWRWSADGQSVLMIDKGRPMRFDAKTGANTAAMAESAEANYPRAQATDRSARRLAVAHSNPIGVRFIDLVKMREEARFTTELNNANHMALASGGSVLLIVNGQHVSQWGRPVAHQAVKHTPAQIKRWVSELGHNRYAVREAATRALIDAGDAAKEALEQADRSDPEVVSRLARIKRGKAAGKLPLKQTGVALELDGDVNQVVVHPDETHWAAITGYDAHGTIVVGRITPDGPKVVQRLGATHGPASLTFSADGRTLYVANRNGTMSVYAAGGPTE